MLTALLNNYFLYFIIQDLFCVLLQFIFPIIFSIFIIITNGYHKDERIIEERKCIKITKIYMMQLFFCCSFVPECQCTWPVLKDWFSDFSFHWMMWNEVTECIGVQVSQLIESVGFSMYNSLLT